MSPARRCLMVPDRDLDSLAPATHDTAIECDLPLKTQSDHISLNDFLIGQQLWDFTLAGKCVDTSN